MNAENGYNDVTVDWQGKEVSIDASKIPLFDADQTDIEKYQQDGVVLLKSAFIDWVDVLRSGLQRNLDNPQQFAFPCESNPDGEPGRFFDSY
jgi:hypothetical protein